MFGSDYRTPPGRSEPGNTAQRLLEGGPVAVAVAAAGLRAQDDPAIESIATFAPSDDAAVADTAHALADRLGATLSPNGSGRADLIVVGSPASGGEGRTGISGLHRSQLNSALGSVLDDMGYPVHVGDAEAAAHAAYAAMHAKAAQAKKKAEAKAA